MYIFQHQNDVNNERQIYYFLNYGNDTSIFYINF